MKKLLDLPNEILEHIFYFCDFSGFQNSSMTCRKLHDFYHCYNLHTFPLYLGFVKICIQSQRFNPPDIESDSSSDSDSDINLNNELNTFIFERTQNKVKILLTKDIEQLNQFFTEWSYANCLLKITTGRIKFISYHFKTIQFGEKIIINNLKHFIHYRLDYSNLFNEYYIPSRIPLYTNIRQRKNQNAMKIHFFNKLHSISKKYAKHTRYIKTYLGKNKFIHNVNAYKIVMVETSPFNNLVNITFIKIYKKKIITSEIKKEIEKLKAAFISAYPYIKDFTIDYQKYKMMLGTVY